MTTNIDITIMKKKVFESRVMKYNLLTLSWTVTIFIYITIAERDKTEKGYNGEP